MTNNKELPYCISTSSDNGDMVTMDTTDSNTSTHHSSSSDAVVDVTRDAKRIKKLKKRSLPAMNSSNGVDGGSKAKKKRKSLDSRLVDAITKKVTYIHKCTVSTYICNKCTCIIYRRISDFKLVLYTCTDVRIFFYYIYICTKLLSKYQNGIRICTYRIMLLHHWIVVISISVIVCLIPAHRRRVVYYC